MHGTIALLLRFWNEWSIVVIPLTPKYTVNPMGVFDSFFTPCGRGGSAAVETMPYIFRQSDRSHFADTQRRLLWGGFLCAKVGGGIDRAGRRF